MKKRSTIHNKCFGDDGRVNEAVLHSSEANERLLAELKAARRNG